MWEPSTRPCVLGAKVGSQSDDGLVGSEAGAQQSGFVEPLDPLRIIDVGLATGHGRSVVGVDQYDLRASCLQDPGDRDRVVAGLLHCCRGHSDARDQFGS